MPESMFGRPSQHLLPSQPQANAGPSSNAPDPSSAPVQPAPLQFKDFRFNSIGKQPELLSRISLPQPDNTDYRSPTPSPAPTSPPFFTNDLQSKPSLRPTLLQQLAGGDFSSLDGGARWNAQTSQTNISLASRIQMNDTSTNDIANTAHSTVSKIPSPPLRVSGRPIEDASLIPPVEVLPQPPDSSPPTPASWAPILESAVMHSPACSTPLVNTTRIMNSQMPTSAPAAMNTIYKEPAELLPSLTVVDAPMQDLHPSPSATAAINSFLVQQERLQSISAKLAQLASPLPPPPSQSPVSDPSSVIRTITDSTPDQLTESQHNFNPIVLRHPYTTNQSSGRVELNISDAQIHTNDSSLALVPSPTILTQEYQNQSTVIAAAVQNLSSVLNAVHLAHIDNENALALRIRTFEEQRTAFEQTQRVREATLQQELQELQQKREELNAKEALLASLEKEIKAREDARKGLLAKRQAQEEEKRAAEAKRVQEVQEQIATAMDELKKTEALKTKCRVEQLASETVQDELPIKPQEVMNEDEKAAIQSRNDLLCAVKHLRRMHTDKVRKLEETNCTLRRLGEEREKREAEEAERRRVAEEHLRANAEIERARQIIDLKRRQSEADRKRQEVENDREQARLLAEQQVHAEAQAHGLGRVEVTNGQTFERQPGALNASKERAITHTARIRAARKENSFTPEAIDPMNVDDDDRVSALHQSPPDIHENPGASKSKQRDKPISGGVMLAASSPKASGGHIPRKPLTTPPSLPSSDHVVENGPNTAGTPITIPVSTEGNHRSSFPVQSTSGSGRTVTADIRPTPDYKPAFSRAPKSRTILDATNAGSQELNIGPLANVSPTQQNVNLRHLKRFRGRVEGNDGGDRSVRTIQVKNEENPYPSPKKEERVDRVVQPSLSVTPPASLPPRPAIIPPPRPRKRHEVPASQMNSPRSFPPDSNELSLTSKEAEVITDEQPRELSLRVTTSSQAMNAPVQLPAPFETTNSLLLGPVYAELETSESRVNVGERHSQDRGENYDTTPSEPASTTLPHVDGEDPPRSNRRFTDEHRRARNANGSRRAPDNYPPPSRSAFTSPTQPHCPIDSWRSQNSSNGPRAEPMRGTSPITGRKRPSEFNDNEHGHRVRRQRGDVWIAQDHDRERTDFYRPHWDRRVDPEPDERRAAYRAPNSPVDRSRHYPSDVQRTTYDNRTYTSEEPTASATRWEQSYRRSENDDIYQRHQPSAPVYNPVVDQHHPDDIWVGTYEPMTGERLDTQPDPSLLARMHDTQRFPPRGRGRGEPSRGRGDSGRGRGRGVVRGGPPLIDRLKPGPTSLGDRLT